MIKVLLADDQELIRQSLSFVMSKQEDIEMVGTAANGCEALELVEEKQPGAKEVETRYETIAVSGRLALLKVQLITGRTHQIRAHMASIGCPILGDSKYGNNTANRELKLKYQALCAWELTMPRFNQPDFEFLSGKTFRAPKPWYYSQVLDGTLK